MPVWAALLMTLALVASACGDDDDGGETAAPASTSGSAETTTSSAGQKATGEPIKIGSIVEVDSKIFSSPEVVAAHDAYAEYVNEELGGVNGRPIEIVNCDDHGDPGQNAGCAQQLIDDGVVAFVDNTTSQLGSNGMPLIEAAGIPAVGGSPQSGAEYSSDYNFPTIGGGAGTYPAISVYFAENGAKTMNIVYPDIAPGKASAEGAAAAFEAAGGEEAFLVAFDPAAPDFTPALTTATANGADVTVLLTSQNWAVRLVQAADIAGLEGDLVLPGAANTPEVIEAAGPAIEGAFFSSAFLLPTDDDPEVREFVEVMERYAPDLEIREKVQNSAASVDLLVRMMERAEEEAGEITPASILAALSSVAEESLLMAHAWGPELAPAQLPKVWNPYYVIVRYQDGEYSQVSDWVAGL
ncbi:MAG: ABC transporter substrate-binding protein [Acidimicrobiia bacterium]|nr:ABC transporter substrate-binding protein [Acidimicrobiia bacterium]